MACDEFELQIEMRLHGAPVSSTLDEHLATCEHCRAFETLATRMEQTMTQTATLETKQIDWQALRESISARLTRDTKVRTAVFAAVLVAQAIAMATFAPNRHFFPQVFRSFGLVAAVILVGLALGAFLRYRRLRAYETSREDLLFFQRSYLEGRLWRTTLAAIVLAPFGLSYIAVRLPRPHVDLSEWLGASMMTVIFVSIAGYLFFVQRPRLVRELASFRQRK